LHAHRIGQAQRRDAGAEGPVTAVGRPELQKPAPDRLIGDVQTAFGEEFFDVAIAEGETHIEPNGVLNDHWRELVARI